MEKITIPLILVVVCIIGIIGFLLLKKEKVENFEKVGTIEETQDTCVLLTTTVYINTEYKNASNTPEIRLKLYVDCINEWLSNTNLTIYIVESSNYDFPEFKNNPRVKVFTFKSSNDINCKDCSATPYEAEAILKAFKHFKLNKFKNIIKITGKYFIPNMEALIRDIPENSEIFYQHSKQNGTQNSEIFGCKTKILPDIMNKIIENSKKNMNFEKSITDLKYRSYTFPMIMLNKPVQRSGDNKLMYYL